ncbi:MAG TPA: hypothetical protein VEK55_06220 [Xanthobacteraceae bacterium]|nr:hypothetical protein [Xanthobacteraceae bacterium]
MADPPTAVRAATLPHASTPAIVVAAKLRGRDAARRIENLLTEGAQAASAGTTAIDWRALRHVTTKQFLLHFGFDALRDLLDMERR